MPIKLQALLQAFKDHVKKNICPGESYGHIAKHSVYLKYIKCILNTALYAFTMEDDGLYISYTWGYLTYELPCVRKSALFL